MLSACGEAPPVRQYNDLSTLEQPPDIVKKEAKARTKGLSGKTAAVKKGLADQVSLQHSENGLVLIINRSFGKSWRLMRKALELNKTKIVDKNRSKGAFYISYDADDAINEDNKNAPAMTKLLSLFDNQYNEQDFLLRVITKGEQTRVIAEPVDINDKLDDEKGDFDQPTDSIEKLLTDLFITLRDEVPES